MFSRWISWSGASRTPRTSRRRSFKTTSAARVTSVSPMPCEISASVFTLQGSTIMPIVTNEPLEIAAP